MTGGLNVELKGIYRVMAKGRAYYYAWRGGPRLQGEPGSIEFIESYVRAHRKIPQDSDLFAAHVVRYKSSPDFGGRSLKWRAQKQKFLDLILDDFGDAPLEVFEDKGIRKDIKRFKAKFKATPRKADQIIGELSTFLNWCKDEGELAQNFAERISKTPKRDFSEVIWTLDEIEAICGEVPVDVAHGVRLAALTGLARADLISLRWDEIKDDAISTARQKTGEQVLVPLYDDLKALLAEIKNHARTKGVISMTVLSNRFGKPYSGDGLTSTFNRAKKAIGIDKRFHDLRGTAVTRFYALGFQDDEVADLAGWNLASVRAIKKKYVSRQAVNAARIVRLNRTNGH